MKTKITEIQRHWLWKLAEFGGYSPMKGEAKKTFEVLIRKRLATKDLPNIRYRATDAGRRFLLEIEPALSMAALEEIKRALSETESNQLRSIAEAKAYHEALLWAESMRNHLNSKGSK